jgi:hypothetical protein
MNSDETLIAYAHAVYVSQLATGSQPKPVHVLAVIEDSIDRCAWLGGCECLVAQDYGDRPEIAATRMRWALHVAAEISSVCAPAPAIRR